MSELLSKVAGMEREVSNARVWGRAGDGHTVGMLPSRSSFLPPTAITHPYPLPGPSSKT